TLPAEFVSNLNEDDEIEISVNGKMLRCNVRRQEVIDHPGRHEFVLLGDTWDTLVKSLDLKIGSVCVFTKNRGKRLWFDAFDDDGHMVTNVVFKGDAILRRHQLQLTLLEESFDQSKINTLQTFYVVVNQLNVDYAQLIWTGFLYQVEKKLQRAVQYP
ncbi:reverse transcriptase domain-containing protein, partial [Tanacetum coccineum]